MVRQTSTQIRSECSVVNRGQIRLGVNGQELRQ
jgi:hypothetical protein